MNCTEIDLNSKYLSDYLEFINKYRDHLTNRDSFIWEFSHNPIHSVITALENNYNIYGTQCMIPIFIRKGDKEYLSAKCENSYLDASLRGKGYFPDLFKYAKSLCLKKGIHILWAFTTALKPYKELGFDIYENCLKSLHLYIRFQSFSKFTINRESFRVHNKVLKYLVYVIQVIYFRFLFNVKSFHIDKKSIDLVGSTLQKNDIERFNATLYRKNSSIIFIDNNEVYLKWRINDNPNLNYITKYFYHNGTLIGYCIFSIKNEKIIIQYFVYSDDDKLEGMIHKLLGYFIKTQNYQISFYANYENEINKNVFLNLGSFCLRKIDMKGIPFVYSIIADNNIGNVDSNNWFINLLWTEGY